MINIKTIFESIIISFSMYSKIPMPYVQWKEENMKYAMCFFPLVGLAIGIVMGAWMYLAKFLGIGNILFAGIATIIPVIISGGIHIDGFCDTVDARSSHQSAERKLEILKDPHIGAFALIYCVVYFIAVFSFWTEININMDTIIFIALGFMLSRAFSAVSIVTFKCSKNSGLAYMFSNAAEKQVVKKSMFVLKEIGDFSFIYRVQSELDSITNGLKDNKNTIENGGWYFSNNLTERHRQ